MKKKMLDINLQKFGEEKEVTTVLENLDEEETEELETAEESSEEELEDVESSEIEESEDKKKKPSPQEKADYAARKAKEENKKLKQQLAEIQAEKDRSTKKELLKSEHKTKYTEKGYDDETSDKLAEIDVEKDLRIEEIERRLEQAEYKDQARILEKKYPEIMDKLPDLIKVCKVTGWSLEKVARAELEEFSYEQKVDNEVKSVINRRKAEVANPGTSTSQTKGTDSVKLSASDQKAYEMWTKIPGNQSKSKKDYLDLFENKI